MTSGERPRAELEAELDRLQRRISGLEEELARRAHAGASLLSVVLENTSDIVSVVTPEGIFLDTNRAAPPTRREQLVGRSLLDYVAPADRERVRGCLERVAATGEAGSFEVEARLSDGTVACYFTRVAPIPPVQGVRALGCVSTDVTRLRAANRALRESEEKLRLAIQATKLGIWIWAPGDRPDEARMTWDETCLRIFGLRADQVPRSRDEYERLVHPDDVALFKAHEASVFRTGAFAYIEYRIVRPDGAVRWVFGRGVIVSDEQGKLQKVMGGLLDVTERRLLEQELGRAHRKQALANLTAGVAHNFNNLLMAILPSTENALATASPVQAPLLEMVRDASLRGASLVRELMLLAGQRPSDERRDEPVAALVERVVSLFRARRPDEVTVDLQASSLKVAMNAPRIEQALLNLLVNARDAVAGAPEGRIVVSVARVPAGAAELSEAPDGLASASCVRISVADNGVGMSPEVEKRVFEPFFTTKPVGKGTGLGLASACVIAREHGGFISCTSRPGAGSTFRLYLPLPGGSAETAAVPPATSRAAAAASETMTPRCVLVVDDEPMVRTIVERILVAHGHRVLTAASGEEALALYAREKGTIDLVLLDESMPLLPGRAVLARLLALDPQARVALFTGNAPDPDPPAGLVGTLAKPVGMQDLLAFVARTAAR